MLDFGFEGGSGGGGIGVAACGEVVFDDVFLGAEETLGARGFEVPCVWNFLICRDVLSVTCHTPKVYTVLFRLEVYKQLAITQIPVVEIDNFIRQQTKPLAKMTRAEVRAAVNRFLNPEGISAAPAKQSEQLLLPGFGKWLETATGFEAESIVRAVDDDDTADRSYRAGCLLLGAALDYQRRQETPDTVMLLNLKTALLDEVQAIENILAQE